MTERNRALTPEDLIRRYDLENLVLDRKAIENNRNALTKTDNYINEFVKATLKDIGDIKNQIDGNISTWFFNGVPSLENAPADEWLTDIEKNNHLGDLYYDKETGHGYRWSEDDGVWKWVKIDDSAITQALAIANAAQDTADSKRRVFVTEPIPPYDVGDIWFKEDKEIFRCRASRTEGTYNEVDWCKACDYSNDDYAKEVEAVLNQFKTEVSEDYTTHTQLEISKDSILGLVESETKRVETIQQNNYNELIDKLGNYETIENITLVKQQVSNLTTSTSHVISVIEDIQINGVNQVRTENNYTFNKDGLCIDEEGAKAKNLLDNNGMNIIDKTGKDDESLLFAGYDEDLGESIVRSKNITVEKYLTVGKNSRFEDYVDDNGNEGTGCFVLEGND